jgi:transcriptional regulator
VSTQQQHVAPGGLEQTAGAESLYIPRHHCVEDREFLHDFMDEFSFVDLVTSTPTVRITHIPVLLDRGAGEYGTIRGHVSRQNPQHECFDGCQPAVIVFRGPHSYISPTWYAKAESVPTWNFAVVHASGNLRAITGKAELQDLLNKLIRKFEGSGQSAYDFAALPDSYKNGMIAAIVGFEMEIEVLEGKVKFGQERSEADKEGILRHLRSARPERSLHDLTEAFYARRKNAEASIP